MFVFDGQLVGVKLCLNCLGFTAVAQLPGFNTDGMSVFVRTVGRSKTVAQLPGFYRPLAAHANGPLERFPLIWFHHIGSEGESYSLVLDDHQFYVCRKKDTFIPLK